MIAWLLSHWEIIAFLFYALEKAVHMSPLVWNDLLVDPVRSVLKALEDIRKGY